MKINWLAIVLFLFIVCSLPAYGQRKLENYIGFYFSGDASMYYHGISIAVGTDIEINSRVTVSPYGQYFGKNFGDHSFSVWTVGIPIQFFMGEKKRFFLGFGPALQRALEKDDLYPDVIDRLVVLPMYRIGSYMNMGNMVLCAEFTATGPYVEQFTTELFTLPSLGIRLFPFASAHKLKLNQQD